MPTKNHFPEVSKPSLHCRRSRRNIQGFALVLTLACVVLVTIIVVTYATLTRFESASARRNFDAQRAKALAALAVDEVTATLRDNIPLDSQWAAAPGRLYNAKTGITTPLHSGTTNSADTTGTLSVALNTPFIGATSEYPIVPKNADYPTPDPMKVDWIYVLQDGTHSTDASYAPTASNPIVGRYGYWVDTETSKVNLNTAGKAQTTYRTRSVGMGSNDDNPNITDEDLQNLTGHPSRVDLSKLEDVTPQVSLDTYNFAASSSWFGGVGSDNVHDPLTITPIGRSASQGLKRFNSLNEWLRIPGVSATAIEANKFYLTSEARAPELNPWGFNKCWWQTNTGPQRHQDPWNPRKIGNHLNAPGAPLYPPNLTEWPWNAKASPDTRYYVYPAMSDRWGNQAGNLQSPNWMGNNTGKDSFQIYMTNMIALLSRTDWPGMPAKSFVEKYGLEECETLAVNMLFLYDSLQWGFANAFCTGYDPNVPYHIIGYDNNKTPPEPILGNGIAYGSQLIKYTRPNGTVRRMTGLGLFPHLNEIAVTFSPSRGWNGQTKLTKDGWGPARAPYINGSTDPNHINVQAQINFEMVYPPSLAHASDFVGYKFGHYAAVGMTSIEAFARGTYNGNPVTYGYDGSPPLQPTWEKPTLASTQSQYTWGFMDTGIMSTFNFGFPYNMQPHGQYSKVTPTPTPYSGNSPSLDFGPFDIGTQVTVEVKFRVVSTRMNVWTNTSVLQMVPVVVDYTNNPDNPANPTKLAFSATFNLDGIDNPTKSVEVIDPRVSRYLSDWHDSTATLGHTMGSNNSGYVSSFLDPLTGITGDSSKFMWPDIGAAARGIPGQGPMDIRSNQNATNIVGFPGVGWLSVLPTNVESGGTWSGAVRTPNPSGPVPWRTLSLEPAVRSNQLPDWLLLDIFAIAYDRTFLSQTQGKINVNASVAPFGINRLAPLKSLLIPSAANPTTMPATIATDLAASTGAQSGPGGNLPSDIYVYAGQICQVPSMAGTGANQATREALMRDVAGLVTTKCSDFKVYSIAQALAPNRSNPTLPGPKLAEQRLEAVISRVTNVGPDDVPATDDDMAGPDNIVGTADDLKFKDANGNDISKLYYDYNDPDLEGHAGRPPFKFEIHDFNYLSR